MHGTGRYLAALTAALGLTLMVAACGGGGGGAPTPTAQRGDTGSTGTDGTASTHTQADLNRVRAADPEETLQSAVRVADSLPRFGSVTQSTNRDANGVTTDRASAAFDGAGSTVTITRADSSTLTLDTADAVVTLDPEPDTLTGIPGGARTLRGWGTLNVAGRAADAAAFVVTSADGAPNDWLAVGAYLHVAGQNLLSTAPTVTGAEMGAFVDGPELRLPPPNLPGAGTARYEGTAGGLYVTRYGTGYAGVTPGSTAVGGIDATATLTADFANNTISGCIGCKGDVLLSGVITDSASGASRDFASVPSDVQLRLGATEIDSDDTFRSRDVTVFDPAWQRAGLGVTRQSGSWGGRFSNLPVATGEPRLVGGTFGGEGMLNNGTRGAYVGAFVAGKQ